MKHPKLMKSVIPLCAAAILSLPLCAQPEPPREAPAVPPTPQVPVKPPLPQNQPLRPGEQPNKFFFSRDEAVQAEVRQAQDAALRARRALYGLAEVKKEKGSFLGVST